MFDDSKCILEFDDVSFVDETSVHASMGEFSIALKPGDLTVILLERNNIGLPLCDLAEGMLDPAQGTVKFMGQSWREMSAKVVSDMRGRIGRVFHERGWVSNLSVYDNIILNRMFHSSDSETKIRQEAESIGRMFGLDSVSTDRPDAHRPEVLRKYEWVRALLGSPDLILMQHPSSGVKECDINALIAEISRRREKDGAAVLWTTPDAAFFQGDSLNSTFRHKMTNTEMTLIAED